MTGTTFRKINDRVWERFRDNAVIKDRTLRIWAKQMYRQIDPHDTLKFKACDSWIHRFKKRNGVVSRAITERVSKNWEGKNAHRAAAVEDFMEKFRIKTIDEGLLPHQIFNADQSRFEKELHTCRTHRVKGSKDIRAAVGSMSATSHSYMIMPVVSMAGEILRPM